MVISGHGGLTSFPRRAEPGCLLLRRRHSGESVSPADGDCPCGNEELAGGSALKTPPSSRTCWLKTGAPRAAVVFNAAAVFPAGRAKSWKEGTALAGESIDSGRAASVLEKVRAFAEPVRRSA